MFEIMHARWRTAWWRKNATHPLYCLDKQVTQYIHGFDLAYACCQAAVVSKAALLYGKYRHSHNVQVLMRIS